jgi:hypothetical protein
MFDSVSVLSTINLYILYALKVILYFLLMAFLKLFQIHRRFLLKFGFDVRDSDVRDGVSSLVKYIWKPKRLSFTCTICRAT